MKNSLCSFVLTLAAASSVFAMGAKPTKAVLLEKMTVLIREGFMCTELKGAPLVEGAYTSTLECENSDGKIRKFNVRYENSAPKGSKCTAFDVVSVLEVQN